MAENSKGRSGCWRPLGIAVLVIFGLGVIGNLIGGTDGAGGARGEEITQAEYGADWPFTVESGQLYCQGPGSNVVLESGGVIYALNGRARGNAEELGFTDSRGTILLTDDGGYYTIGDTPGIISRGLAMC